MLEAMQERQVSIGDETFEIPSPFLVLATQNPIEQEGTYPLPEAQLDRFMLKLKVDYPTKEQEREILERMAVTNKQFDVKAVISPKDIAEVRAVVDEIYIDEKIKDYIVDVVCATRDPEKYGLKLKNYISYGASPRATIFLAVAAKAHAFIQQRGYVTPQDVKSIGFDVLRHRVIVSYEAEAPHVALAKRLRDTGREVSQGTSIDYIVRKGSGRIGDRAQPVSESSIRDYDADYYVRNQVLPPSMRILSVFGFREEDLRYYKTKQRSLGDFLG